MKKAIGQILIILGGFLCIDSIICIPVTFIADDATLAERISALICLMVFAFVNGLMCWLGFKLKGSEPKRNPKHNMSNEKSTVSVAEKKTPVSEVNIKYVSTRDGIVSDGTYIYNFDKTGDLFSEKKEDLAYPELIWDFRKAANLGKHILDMGGLITCISIGGGCSEISHTGQEAYGNSYGTLDG